MNEIVILDIITFIASLFGIILLLIGWKRISSRGIKTLTLGLLLLTLFYSFSLFIEWYGITMALDPYEDLVGALIPMMWAFIFYTFNQQIDKADLSLKEENLRITLNSIGDAVIATDIYGRIYGINPVAEKLTQWNREDAYGTSLEKVFTIVDADSRKVISNLIGNVIQTGKVHKPDENKILISKDGSEYYISFSIAPIRDEDGSITGIVLVFNDITEKARQELILKESRERLSMAIKGTKAGLWDWYIKTGDYIINERWAEIIGYSMEELGLISIETWEKYVHPEDLKKSQKLLDKHCKGKIDFYECEVRMKHKQGHWVWVMDRGMIMSRDKKGEPVRMTGTHVDITKQKQAEMDLRTQMEENISLNEEYLVQNEELSESLAHIQKINQELSEAREKAEESDRLKSAFLANMSHEIRTPMNGIIGFSEMLNNPELSNDKRSLYSKIIVDSSNQLLTIVNDILDISRIETGMISIIKGVVNVNDVINELYNFFERQAKKNKSLNYESVKDLSDDDSLVMTDKTRLIQVLSNLLSNAFKFTEKGKIHFGYKLKKNNLEFFVEDTGIGIHAQLQKKIFEPFRQGEVKITRQFGGTGLGLSISQKLVTLLGGKIWFVSKVDKGSIFYFTIPYMTLTARHEKIAKEAENIKIDGDVKKILVAEDDEVSYLFIEELLSKSGFGIVRAQNGAEAVKFINLNINFHLVLMDLKMPVLNGYEATKQIKNIRPDLPVIALTAYAMEQDRKKAMDAGCDGYIAKPVKKDQLLSIIKEYTIDYKTN